MFEGQLIAALNASAPLVKVNTQVLVQVHDEAEARASLSFSEIPFAEKSPARARVRKVLEARGQWTPEVERVFGDGGQSFIDMFATLNRPYEPVVFDSLMQPIAREWGKRSRNPDLIQEFWRWRRARPLPEALPMSPSVREAMVRGWFTANRLGHLKIGDERARIYVPGPRQGGAWLEFPEPLLTGSMIAPQQYLPVVLESILLAMVQVNTTASLSPMDPYIRLRNLGRSGTGGVERYEDLNDELRSWIINGDPATSSQPWEERKAAVENNFKKLTLAYTEYFTDKRPYVDPLDVPTSYDLRRDIMNALRDLTRATQAVTADADLGDWN